MGALPGERCGLCGEPMNEGFTVCKACGAVRSTGINSGSNTGCLAVGVLMVAIMLTLSVLFTKWFIATAVAWFVFFLLARKARDHVDYNRPPRR